MKHFFKTLFNDGAWIAVILLVGLYVAWIIWVDKVTSTF